MGPMKSILKTVLQNLGREISSRVHNRHLQARLQIGSSLALTSGLIANIFSLLGWLKGTNALVFDLLIGLRAPGMVDQDPLYRMIVIFLLALLGGATFPHFNLLSATALMILYIVMYLGYAFNFFERGIVVQPVYPLLALVLTFTSEMIFRYFSEARPRASVGLMFKRYVSRDAVDQVLENYDRNMLSLEGTRRKATVLHVDLRELAIAADDLHPQSAVDLVNDYFGVIVPIIFRNSGTIVKQSGTGIVAVWNLPLEMDDYAGAAAQAAIQINNAISLARTPHAKEDTNRTHIHLGFGISTGLAIGGYIGVPTHKEYTIVGEVVTIAERLAMKPDRGVFVDDTTREGISAQFELKEANPIRLRRRAGPTSVWEITGQFGAQHVIVRQLPKMD
jgi:adenylate cyclase